MSSVGQKPKGSFQYARCHPKRLMLANGMCRACYQREWKRQHPGKQLAYDRRHQAKDYVQFRERHRWHKIKAQYGLTRAQFEELWKKQLGLCPICLLALELGPVGLRTKGERWKQYLPANNPRSVTVDHDHATTKVRGLLCRQHNAALALFGDNIDYLNRAIEYLARATTKSAGRMFVYWPAPR